ncbi:AI-2E family transporter [Erythrobacter sp. 3-20A1M]|uniref:AI-2E family transporter n=1 Tax=Erythrobacter sp. 3-20A1M TaxID=2653850 RepID=UPI00203F4BC4|nr:AI-2E family transporter [Erythrobacter sp. 3-20A1M]
METMSPEGTPEGAERSPSTDPLGVQEDVSAPARQMTFADQELRLISLLVLILGAGLFLALPFVLSIGSVVFLPVTTAIIFTILLAPLADRLSGWGVPNTLASILAILFFIGVLAIAFAVILQPAISLFDTLPALIEQVGARFAELRSQFGWLARANTVLNEALGQEGSDRVVLASPSFVQELAIGAPSVVLEVLLTFLMTFFMVEARIRMRRNLLFGRSSFGTSLKAARVMREVQDRVAAYILTVAWINLGIGVIVTLGAWILGVSAPMMWGGLAALLNFIPYIGPLAMTTLLALFGIGTSETVFWGLMPAAAYLCLHAVEANIVTPSILGARFTMNPVMILIAFSYFTWIWGALGALLSVPLLLMLTAFFDHVGRPNLVGFIFGEPLFDASAMADEPDEEAVET